MSGGNSQRWLYSLNSSASSFGTRVLPYRTTFGWLSTGISLRCKHPPYTSACDARSRSHSCSFVTP